MVVGVPLLLNPLVFAVPVTFQVNSVPVTFDVRVMPVAVLLHCDLLSGELERFGVG